MNGGNSVSMPGLKVGLVEFPVGFSIKVLACTSKVSAETIGLHQEKRRNSLPNGITENAV